MKMPSKPSPTALQFAGAAAAGAVVGTVGTFAALNVALSLPKHLRHLNPRKAKDLPVEETTVAPE
jgi:hypothetical protein